MRFGGGEYIGDVRVEVDDDEDTSLRHRPSARSTEAENADDLIQRLPSRQLGEFTSDALKI